MEHTREIWPGLSLSALNIIGYYQIYPGSLTRALAASSQYHLILSKISRQSHQGSRSRLSISLDTIKYIQAVWPGLSLSALNIIGYYQIYPGSLSRAVVVGSRYHWILSNISSQSDQGSRCRLSISLDTIKYIQAVWAGLSLSALDIIGYYQIYPVSLTRALVVGSQYHWILSNISRQSDQGCRCWRSISLDTSKYIQAVWPGLSLSALNIIGYYQIYPGSLTRALVIGSQYHWLLSIISR